MKSALKWMMTPLIGILAVSATTAQFSFGVRSGITWTNVHKTDALNSLTPDFHSVESFQIGALAEYKITDHFAIQPELNFQKQGFALDEGLDAPLFGMDLPVGVKSETRFSYLSMPVLAKYEFGNDKLRFHVMAGPAVSYATAGKIDTKAKVLVDINLGSTDINLDNLNDFNRWEASAVAGAGVSYDAGFGKLFADFRYQHGFTEVYNIPVVDEKVTNRGFGLSAGIMIPL